MTWKEWKTLFPTTLVLSTRTGHNRDYNRVAYSRYLASERVMFPVDKTNKVFGNKEVVLGVQVGDKFKAYPFFKLKSGVIKDNFNGEVIQIIYNEETNSAWLGEESSEKVKATRLFWFAWFAFHPNTEIFNP